MPELRRRACCLSVRTSFENNPPKYQPTLDPLPARLAFRGQRSRPAHGANTPADNSAAISFILHSGNETTSADRKPEVMLSLPVDSEGIWRFCCVQVLLGKLRKDDSLPVCFLLLGSYFIGKKLSSGFLSPDVPAVSHLSSSSSSSSVQEVTAAVTTPTAAVTSPESAGEIDPPVSAGLRGAGRVITHLLLNMFV